MPGKRVTHKKETLTPSFDWVSTRKILKSDLSSWKTWEEPTALPGEKLKLITQTQITFRFPHILLQINSECFSTAQAEGLHNLHPTHTTLNY